MWLPGSLFTEAADHPEDTCCQGNEAPRWAAHLRAPYRLPGAAAAAVGFRFTRSHPGEAGPGFPWAEPCRIQLEKCLLFNV